MKHLHGLGTCHNLSESYKFHTHTNQIYYLSTVSREYGLISYPIDPGLTSTCLCKLSSQILSDSSKISTKCITSSKNFLGQVLELDTNVFHTKETVNNKMVSAANFDMLLSTDLL